METTSWQQWLIVIPARMGSERLKNKPLQLLGNKPLIVRTYENLATLCSSGATAIVATDHQEILQVCAKYSIKAVMTNPNHQSGTDRVFEVSKQHSQPFVMNLQGDEPFMNHKDIEKLMKFMESNQQADLATLVYASGDGEKYQNPNCVKAVGTLSGRALYFSRSPIPYLKPEQKLQYWQHQGVYAYRRESLAKFCGLPPSNLEKQERLEQLRALENGMHIQLIEANHPSIGIDTIEDLKAAHALL